MGIGIRLFMGFFSFSFLDYYELALQSNPILADSIVLSAYHFLHIIAVRLPCTVHRVLHIGTLTTPSFTNLF